jgi:hypothetical protein
LQCTTPAAEVGPHQLALLAGGLGGDGYLDATGPAARLDHPAGVAVDVSGNVYVVDLRFGGVRKIDPDGVVTTLAGIQAPADYPTGDVDGTTTTAVFDGPSGLAVGDTGNVYVSEISGTIRRIAADGTVTTLAGKWNWVGSTDGTGADALFNYPYGIAVDEQSNVYVADTDNSTIRKVTPDGECRAFHVPE